MKVTRQPLKRKFATAPGSDTLRFDESVAEAKRAVELDPLSEFAIDFSDWAYYLNRHYDLGLSGARKAIELYPSLPWAHCDLAYIYEQTGRPAQAMEEYLKAQQNFGLSEERSAELRKAYQLSGEKGYWRKVLEFCEAQAKRPREFAAVSGYGWCDYVQRADMALIYSHLGDKDALRPDPRFADLLRGIGIPGSPASSPR